MIKALSRPWPLNALSEPCPADWGIGMTVCIAANSALDDTMICVTDKMISTATIAADVAQFKGFPFGDSWFVMLAGNDVGDYIPVRDFVAERLDQMVLDGKFVDSTFKRRELIKALEAAIRSRIAEKAEIQHLAPLGLTMENYRDEGPKLGAETFSRLVYNLQDSQLDMQFLAAGYDKNVAHISAIDGLGNETNFDLAGFWAIGSGQTAALGYLFGSGITQFCKVDEVLLAACFAKFSAESAPSVGKETVVTFITGNKGQDGGYTYTINKLRDNGIAQIRRLWEQRVHEFSDAEKAEARSVLQDVAILHSSKRNDTESNNTKQPSASQTSTDRQ